MKLENQVTNLKLSQKLKKLGAKQESLWYHIIGLEVDDEKNGDSYDSWFQDDSYELMMKDRANEAIQIVESDDYTKVDKKFVNYFSAFTVTELGEMLPNNINGDWLVISKNPKEWIVEYQDMGLIIKTKTEVNARAKMLIYLLENKLIK